MDFANNTILSCFFLFFLFIDVYFLIPAVVKHIFNPTAEHVSPIGIPTKEAKGEMETHPVIVAIYQNNSKLYKLFYASYSSIHFFN